MTASIVTLSAAILLLVLFFTSNINNNNNNRFSSIVVVVVDAAAAEIDRRSPNRQNLLNYTGTTEEIGYSTRLASCHGTDDGTKMFCGCSGGSQFHVSKITLSPWSVDATVLFSNSIYPCTLGSTRFYCRDTSVDGLIAFDTVGTFQVVLTIDNQATGSTEEANPIILNDFMYWSVTSSAILRVDSLSTDPTEYTTSVSLPVTAIGMCLGGDSESNWKLVASGHLKVFGIDISGPAGSPSFALVDDVVVDTDYSNLQHDHLACTTTHAFGVQGDDTIARFQIFPSVAFLDFVRYRNKNPNFDGITVFGLPGQELLLFSTNNANEYGLLLFDPLTWPNSVLDNAEIDGTSKTTGRAVINMPKTIGPRTDIPEGGYKVFVPDSAGAGEVHVHKLSQNVSRLCEALYPAVFENVTRQVENEMNYCEMQSDESNIFCFDVTSTRLVRFDVATEAVVETETNGVSSTVRHCTLVEKYTAYYCVFYVSGVGDDEIHIFDMNPLALRTTTPRVTTNMQQQEKSKILFATFGAKDYLFFTDGSLDIHRVETDGTSVSNEATGTIEAGFEVGDILLCNPSLSTTIVAISYEAQRRLNKFDGSVSDFTTVAATDTSLPIDLLNLHSNEKEATCTPTHVFIAEGTGDVFKISIEPTLEVVGHMLLFSSPLTRSMSLTHDMKYLIYGSSAPSMYWLIDTENFVLVNQAEQDYANLPVLPKFYACPCLSNNHCICPGEYTFDIRYPPETDCSKTVSLTKTQSTTKTLSSTASSSTSVTVTKSATTSMTATSSASSTSTSSRSTTATRSLTKSATSTKTQTRTSSASTSSSISRSISKTLSVTASITRSKSFSRSRSGSISTSPSPSRSTTVSSSRSITVSSSRSLTASHSVSVSASFSRTRTTSRSSSKSLQSLSKSETTSKTKTKSKTKLPPTTTTTTAVAATTTTTTNPANNVVTLPASSRFQSALVASVPSCPSNVNSHCQLRHPQTNECRCPSQTVEQNITVSSSYAFLPSSSSTSQLIDRVGNPCVRNDFVISICSASSQSPFLSAYIRSGGTTSENGICEQVNPFTGDCSCQGEEVNPRKAAFAIATGTRSSFLKKFLTFCLPSDLSAFWTIHPDVKGTSRSSSSSLGLASFFDSRRAEQTECISPDGNLTCECENNQEKVSIGASVFPDASSTEPVPGDMTFCKAKPKEKEDEVDIPTTTAVTVGGIVGGFVEGGGANAVVGIQVAALLMTLCDNNPNVSTSGAKSVVVFFEYPGVGRAGGLAFMLTLTLGMFFLHILACFLLGLKRVIFTDPIEFDPDRIDFFEEPIDSPSFFDQIRFASLQLRFPHWSFFVMNIGFSGVVVESTVLLQDTDDDTMVIVGVIGLFLTLVYIALTFYISYWGLRGATEGQTIFDVIESEEMKKIKTELKKTKKKLAKKSDDDQSRSQRRRGTRVVPVEEKATSSEDDGSDDDDDVEDGHQWMSRRKSLVSSQSTTARNLSTANQRRNTAARNRRTASTTRNPRSRSNNKNSSSRRKSTKEEQSALQQQTSFSPSSSSRSSSLHNLSAIDRRNSMVRMPNDNEDNINEEHSKKEANNESSDNSNNNNNAEVTTSSDSDSTSSSSTFSRKSSSSSSNAMKRNKANPLRGPVGSSRRRFNRSELPDTSSSEEISSSSSDEEEEESFDEEEEKTDQQQQQEVMMRILEEDKPPHYVKYGKAMQLFSRFCALGRFILPDGWWIKHRRYNRRYASMYNSFQPRPTAWAPLVVRLFLFSVSVASSLGGCLVPLTYVGTVSLLIALVFLVARPCRRPFDNILLALQLTLGSTLAFSRASDPALSVKLFYGVIGVTFLYVFHIIIMELLEAISMSSLEMEKFSSETAIEDDAKKTNARRTSSLSKKITKK